MDITTLLRVAESIFESLKSEQVEKSINEILGITEELTETVKQIFHLTTDAADDVVAIAMIALNTAEQITNEEMNRAMPKPLDQVTSLEDVTVIAVQRVRSLSESPDNGGSPHYYFKDGETEKD